MLKNFAGRVKGLGAVMALMAGVFLTGPLHAAVYVGKWDPIFGPDFPDLGWKGEAKFFVPNACLSHSGLVFNAESCSNSSMSLLSARVDFYKVSDPANATFQESIFFNTPSPLVTWVLIDDGMLSGVHGSFDYLVAATLPLAGGPDTKFILSFEDTIARLGFVSESHSGFSEGAPITFQLVVPEPGSVTLLALALAATTWLSRRRPDFCQRQ